MSTSVVAPAAGGSAAPATLDSAVDAVFDNIGASTTDTGSQDEPAAAPEADAAPPAMDAPTEEPVAEPEAEAAEPEAVEAQPPAEEIEFEDDLASPDKVSPDGKMHYYRKPRAERMVADHKAWKSVQEAIPGATVEALKENFDLAARVDEMLADYQSATPESMDKFVGYWFNENPHAAGMMAMRMLGPLQQKNPQAYGAMEGYFRDRQVTNLYREAVQRGDQELWKLAANLDKKLTGKWTPWERLQENHDPLADREAQLQQRERAIEERTRAEHEQSVRNFVAETDRARKTAVEEEILGPRGIGIKSIEAAFKDRPQWNWMKRDLLEKIEAAKEANPAWMRQFRALQARAQAQPSEEARQALVDMERQFAANVISRNRKAVIDAAGVTAMSQSAATHQKLAAAAQKVEPGGGQTPVQRATVKQKLATLKQQGKDLSSDEVWNTIGW